MAKFDEELPNDMIKEFESLYNNLDKVMGKMTEEGAKVVYNNILNNMPKDLKKSGIKRYLKISKVYKTLTDKGINSKVAFFGDYYKNSEGKEVPIDLVVKVFEYGRHDKKIPKSSFIRKSFNKSQIENAMKKISDEYFPKDE